MYCHVTIILTKWLKYDNFEKLELKQNLLENKIKFDLKFIYESFDPLNLKVKQKRDTRDTCAGPMIFNKSKPESHA